MLAYLPQQQGVMIYMPMLVDNFCGWKQWALFMYANGYCLRFSKHGMFTVHMNGK